MQVTARDDNRMTAVGRFLRQAKMDELPELLNILKGGHVTGWPSA
ncbi:MAG: sugar transferase [Pyrinomonadaceae bacterium]